MGFWIFFAGFASGFFLPIAFLWIATSGKPREDEKPKGDRCVRCKYPQAKQPGSLCPPCVKAVEVSRPKAPPSPPPAKWRPPLPPKRLPDQHIYVHHAK